MRWLDHPGFRVIATLEVALLGVAVAVTAALGQWGGTATLGIFFAGATALVTCDRRLPAALHAFVVLAALLDAVGFVFSLYAWWMFDEVAHGYTTMALSMSLGYILYTSTEVPWRDYPALLALSVASFGLAIGVGWELLEWVLGVGSDLRDTYFDLVLDAMGAAAGGAVSAWLVTYGDHARAPRPSYA